MKTLTRQRKDGYFDYRVEVADGYKLKANETFDECPANTFVKKGIKKSKWVETATKAEIEAYKKNERANKYVEIDTKIATMLTGAMAILMDAKGLSTIELNARREFYQSLSDACKDKNGSFDDMLEIKKDLFNAGHGTNLTLDEYKAMVIQKTIELNTAFEKFKLMSETARTKWKLLADDDMKFEQFRDKLDELNEDVDASEIPKFFQELMKI